MRLTDPGAPGLGSMPVIGTLAMLAILAGWLFHLSVYLGAWLLDVLGSALGHAPALLARLLRLCLTGRYRAG